MIPEDVLKDMIEEVMITDAVITKLNVVSGYDSIDYYRPIFDKYGYDLDDVEYTLKQLASRQSKPLSNIYDQIQSDLNEISAKVKFNYQRRESLDNIAMLCYTDTLYKLNDTIVGKTGKFRAVIENPIKGKYHFTFMYQGMKEYNIPLRQVVGLLTYKDKSIKGTKQTTSVSRSFNPNMIRLVINVPDSTSYDSLVFRIDDPDYSKSKVKVHVDSSRAYDFRVVYIPERNDARKVFFTLLTGIDLSKPISPLSQQYDIFKMDSCSVWPLPRR